MPTLFAIYYSYNLRKKKTIYAYETALLKYNPISMPSMLNYATLMTINTTSIAAPTALPIHCIAYTAHRIFFRLCRLQYWICITIGIMDYEI